MHATRKNSTATRVTFQETLKQIVASSAARLMDKARLYNRLAKAMPNAQGRGLAYELKDRCLKQLIDKCDGVVKVRHDRMHPDWGILVVKVDGIPGGLHTHPRWLARAA